MQNEKMRKFLDGNANDQEFVQCETLLESMNSESIETVVDENTNATKDSLMVSLRSSSQIDQPKSEDSKRLTDTSKAIARHEKKRT